MQRKGAVLKSCEKLKLKLENIRKLFHILFTLQQAFDKDYNDCKSLVSPTLTKKQKKQIYDNMEKSKLAKLKFTLEDIKEINPVS